jgi:hypothetical protein
VSYEQHCRSCGSVNNYESRQRCDGCGRLVAREDESLRHIVLPNEHEPYGSQNPIGLCPACFVKVSVPKWLCARCAHPRHMHNAGCLVLFDLRPEGGYRSCDCSEFVMPLNPVEAP